MNVGTLSFFYKQRFISNDFLTSLFLKKIKNYSKAISKTSIHKMFRDNKNRFNNFSLELDNFLFE